MPSSVLNFDSTALPAAGAAATTTSVTRARATTTTTAATKLAENGKSYPISFPACNFLSLYFLSNFRPIFSPGLERKCVFCPEGEYFVTVGEIVANHFSFARALHAQLCTIMTGSTLTCTIIAAPMNLAKLSKTSHPSHVCECLRGGSGNSFDIVFLCCHHD